MNFPASNIKLLYVIKRDNIVSETCILAETAQKKRLRCIGSETMLCDFDTINFFAKIVFPSIYHDQGAAAEESERASRASETLSKEKASPDAASCASGKANFDRSRALSLRLEVI